MSIKSNSPAKAINELSLIRQGENFLYDALLLHGDLQVRSVFQNWIKRRIEEFGFVQGADYFPNLEIVKGSKKPVTKFLLTLDMCKELAMLERNEIGRSIRRYFIQKEKESRVGILPKEAQVFKGLQRKNINNRIMYPFKAFLREKAGYSERSSGYHYRTGYPGHFIVMDNLAYISEELALQIYHTRRLASTRAANKAMQPVLPFNFGEPVQLKGGGHA